MDTSFESYVVTACCIIAFVIFYSIFSDNGVEAEANRIIYTLSTIIRGEVQSITKVPDEENPYDLFTRIYPTLKSMKNDQVDEFVELVKKYNQNWLLESE